MPSISNGAKTETEREVDESKARRRDERHGHSIMALRVS